ncbi:MAG: alpha/beta fold hydrolase [Dehalococcoidia bacterium]
MTTTMPFTEASTSKFVDSKPWPMHYNEAGEGHPVIMIHGGGPGATGWSNFNQNMTQLSKKYRCLAVDMPGWGQSGEVEPGTVNPAAALLGFMDALGIEKAAFLGNSMGGAATLSFAVEHSERVSHIVTMGSAPVGGMTATQPGGGPSEGMKVLFETYEDPSVENFRRLIRVMVYDSSFVTDELLRQRSESALSNRKHLENSVEARRRMMAAGGPPLPSGPTVLHRLTKIDIPALIIHGRDDRTTPLETSLQILSALPNSRMLIFNHCGHWAQLEHAQEFNNEVELFLSTH